MIETVLNGFYHDGRVSVEPGAAVKSD